MKALALLEAPDHVCGRYRVRAFAPALEAVGGSLTVEGLARHPLARSRQFRRASRFDTVLLQRKLLPAWQLLGLRRMARRLVFDFDDAVLYRDSYDPRGPHCRRRASRFARTVRLADAVVAGNDFLARCALDAGARPDRVRVIPTCVDPAKYSPKVHGAASPDVQLVWVGSSSTMQGLELQRAMWDHLASEIPGLKLRLIADRAPDLGRLPVIAIAWSESTEAREIAAGDIGISWIPNDLWSRGKCGLKALQYQAAGLPVVANPVGVHSRMILPGVNGYLPETPLAWAQAIRSLAADPEARARMGRASRLAIEAGYAVSLWSATFLAALSGHPEARPRGRWAANRRAVTPPARHEVASDGSHI